jgi:hypothetical protein
VGATLSSHRLAPIAASISVCGALVPAAFGADIGPGSGSVTKSVRAYSVNVRVSPNNTRHWNDVELRLQRRGADVRKAVVSLRFDMPAMSMGAPKFAMRRARPGLYRYSGPAMSMPGLWVLTFRVKLANEPAFTVVVRDQVRG